MKRKNCESKREISFLKNVDELIELNPAFIRFKIIIIIS